jgi:hypothetical protein
MRAIATEAGVAIGNAYYYFGSKEEPASPLSPFSPASSPTRTAAISLYAEVIEGSRIRVPAGLRDRCRNCSGCTRWGSCSTGCTTIRQGARRPTASLT